MSTEITDRAAVAQFIEEARVRECLIPDPLLPEAMRLHPDTAPHIRSGLGLPFGPGGADGAPLEGLRVLASGWDALEGVMLLSPEEEFDADLRVVVATTNERALRDLLLSFPSGQTGFFYCAGEWTLNCLCQVLDGQAMPAREGYFAVSASFAPHQTYPVNRLSDEDYSIVENWWSPMSGNGSRNKDTECTRAFHEVNCAGYAFTGR